MSDAANRNEAGKLVRARLIITGRVQGVYFRANTVDVATAHNVGGWVKNRPDGAVEAVVEGRWEAVSKVIEWCRVGPPKARVDDVELIWEVYADEFDSFTALTRHNEY
ncbi:MAG: acylphosphatase [Deltaproteobacteria bacterium]|nr:acylphosphatase [Deltaproteobacteria bacterium]